jgi:hypothetical protein
VSLSPSYTDVEIRLLACAEAGYPVEITVDNAREFPRGHLDARILPWQNSDNPEQDGARLFEALLADETLKLAWAEVRSATPQRRIRLRIDATAPELHTLPWELLHEARAGQTPVTLAATMATPFSRYLAGTWQPGAPILRRPVKILAVIPNPANLEVLGLQPFQVDQEWQNLAQAVTDLVTAETVELVQLPQPCTLAALETAIKAGVHILHFIGHGDFNKQDGAARIVMANAANEAELVSDTDFAAMLARQLADVVQQHDDKLRLVYLDSCSTASRDTADAFRGFAPALVKAGVPAVVAMRDKIAVTTGQAFSQSFYRQLLHHGMVDLACNEARAAVLTAGLPGAAIPVLFMRLHNGQLLGQRGQILGEQADSFWNTLLDNIANGECTPFLGPGLTADLLPTPAEIAQTLAAANNYPFANSDNLASVAQFLSISDHRRLLREVQRITIDGFRRRLSLKPDPQSNRQRFPDVVRAVNWSNASRQVLETEIHHQLAELNLPFYVTTNYDYFMALALETKLGRPVRQLYVDWRRSQHQEASRPYYDVDPPASADNPVVLHLFGSLGADKELLAMVLTEDDHLDYLARIARDYEYLLPTSVTSALASTTLLFLGFQLEDLALKVILRGLLTNLDLNRWNMLHVAVQIEATTADAAKESEVIRYFEKYFSRSKIEVYWGSTRQFVADLYARWQEMRHG